MFFRNVVISQIDFIVTPIMRTSTSRTLLGANKQNSRKTQQLSLGTMYFNAKHTALSFAYSQARYNTGVWMFYSN